MNDLAIGRVLRRLRHRLGWRQQDVSERAGISVALYSMIKRGHLERVTLRRLRRVAAVLDVDLPLEARWRGGTLDRMLSRQHSDMAERVARMLTDAGWEVRPEVSFSHFGERGIVDLVAWHPETRTLLLVEIKTELVDVNELLGVADRRRRLASVIAASVAWTPTTVGQWIVLAESRTNRRRLAEHRTVIRAAFPADGRSIDGWLVRPVGPAAALWFLPDSNGGGARPGPAPRQRVRRAEPSVASGGVAVLHPG